MNVSVINCKTDIVFYTQKYLNQNRRSEIQRFVGATCLVQI